MITAYLAVNGNDATAVLDDPSKPFKTLVAAQAALATHSATRIVDLGYVA